MATATSKYGPSAGSLPKSLSDRCGWAGVEMSQEAMQAIGATFTPFAITGGPPDFTGANSTVKLWEVFIKTTGQQPDLSPQPTGNCFVPGSLVAMADGSEKPIQDVRVGDMVVSPTGIPRIVTKLFSRPYTGELVTMRTTLGMRPVTATPDHQFVHYPDRKTGVHRRVRKERVDWQGIGSLQVRDRVLVPYGMDYAGAYQTLDLIQLLGHDPNEAFNSGTVTAGCIQSSDAVRGKMHAVKRPIPTTLMLDERLARLIGLYAAEGTHEPHLVRFSYASDEAETLVAETIALIQSVFGLDCKTRYTNKRKTGMQVICYGKAIADVFQCLVPGNVYTKGFPDTLFCSPKTVRLAALRGWLDGDGHLSNKKKRPHNAGSFRITGVTSSERMAESACRLALSCGLKPSMGVRKKAAHQNEAARTVDFTGNCVTGIYPHTKAPTQIRRVDRVQHGLALPIKELTRTQMVNGTVHCIEVADEHAFIVNGYAVHNCVAASADDALELLQAIQIATGASHEWKPIYNPFHYGTGRVLVGKSRIRGPGSLNSWQTRALLDYGTLTLTPDRPAYTKGNVDAWGDGQKADDGSKFQDFLEEGKKAILKDAAVVERWEQLRDGLKAGHPGTIAGTTGYTMKPNADGFHTVSGDWPHQMSVWGYSDTGKNPWVVLKNQWADVMGTLIDFDTDEPLPKGFIRVRLETFINQHLRRPGTETFVYSAYEGFPVLTFDTKGWA